MARYHINKHGEPAICHAKEGNCPLADEGAHFKTEEEAQAFSDNLNEKTFELFPELKDPFSQVNIRGRFPELEEEEITTIRNYAEKEYELKELVDELKKTTHAEKGSDEYFDNVQKARKQALEKYKLYKNLPINDEQLDELIEEKIPGRPPWKPNPNFEFHPDVTDKTLWQIRNTMAAYSGKSRQEVQNGIKELSRNKDISLQEATEEYWRGLEQRTDKPIVSLDLETANPKYDKSLEYDNGQLTYIIEIGGIKTYPNGEVEEIDIKYGIPKEFEDRHGTGFEETHNISPDEIRGHKEFTDNKENQEKIMNFLDDSVIMAHNAFFEEKQLTNSLRGFKKEVNNGNIEMMDTMAFTKYLVPEAERNTNEALVEAAGMEYEGAHRAYNDAEMTLNAFNKLKDNR